MTPAAIHVVGHGVVARRVSRLLSARAVISHDPRGRTISGVTHGDIAVLAHGGSQAERAVGLLDRGVHVVSVTDDTDDTEQLFELSELAQNRGVSLVVSAAVSPGLSNLIARQMSSVFGRVEIHIAVHGTAGPACARRHHQSLSGRAVSWFDDRWVGDVGGSGRSLAWFPEPIGAKDCYLAQSSEPLLLQYVFPNVKRISHRRSATRRDRLTSRLPMLVPPPEEGKVGGLRVELRGMSPSGARLTTIHGVAELIGTAAAATAAAFVTVVDDLPSGVVVPGSTELPTLKLLHLITDYGVRLQTFTGTPQP